MLGGVGWLPPAGTMTWGEQNTEEEAFEQLDLALSKGVNFLDCAELYPVPPRAETSGATEDILGRQGGGPAAPQRSAGLPRHAAARADSRGGRCSQVLRCPRQPRQVCSGQQGGGRDAKQCQRQLRDGEQAWPQRWPSYGCQARQ